MTMGLRRIIGCLIILAMAAGSGAAAQLGAKRTLFLRAAKQIGPEMRKFLTER
jgi:hypothetical protein